MRMAHMVMMIVMLTMMGASIASAQLSSAKVVSVSLVNQDPDPAVAGNIVEVRISIENLGGSPTNGLMIDVIPSYPFSLLEGESATQEIGSLQGYQEEDDMKIIKYRFLIDANAPAGAYDLEIVYYEQGSQAKVGKTLTIDVKNTDNAEIIHIDRTTLIPGQETTLRFKINNVGNGPLSDLTFRWENSDNAILPVGSDNTKHIKSIPVGGEAEVEYQVIADTNVDTGLYKLDLTLTYKNSVSGVEEHVETLAGIYIGGTTDFEVAFSDSSAGETSFTIANIGSNPAYSVSVSVPKQNGWSVSGSSSAIIGNLNNGDYTLASFTLSSQGGSVTPQTAAAQAQKDRTSGPGVMPSRNSSSGPLTIQIAYTDTMGIRQTLTKEVTVNSQSASTTFSSQTAMNSRQQSTSNSYVWPIAGVIAVILAAIGYKWYTAKKSP